MPLKDPEKEPRQQSEVDEIDSQTDHSNNTNGQITWTPEEEKKLVRKIDLFLMPTIWLMYLLSYMVSTSTTTAFVLPAHVQCRTEPISATRRLRAWQTT